MIVTISGAAENKHVAGVSGAKCRNMSLNICHALAKSESKSDATQTLDMLSYVMDLCLETMQKAFRAVFNLQASSSGPAKEQSLRL